MVVTQNRAPWHRSDRSASRGTGLAGRCDRSDRFGLGRPNCARRGCLSREVIRRHTILISCVNFCDCSNRLRNASANCLMESKVKLTSLGVEADEAAAVAVVDGFGGGGVNVGILNSSFLNTRCRVFPKHASNLFLASSCSFWNAASNCLHVSSGMSSY